MPVIGSASGKEIPSSVVVSATAASYTVPAGFYAIVKAQVRNGGTFSVNGTVVLTSNTWNTIANNNGLYRSPGTPQLISNGFINQTYRAGALYTGAAEGNGQLAGGNSTGNTLIGYNNGSSVVRVTTVDTVNTANMVDVYTNATAMTAIEQQFKVPTGTVVVGSGNASYCIELYSV